MTEIRPDGGYPPGRYGRRREPRRTRRATIWLLAALTGLATAGISLRMYARYGRPEYTPHVVSFTPDGPGGVLVTLLVDKPGGGPAVCHLRALTYEVEEVGTLDTEVPSGRRVTVTRRLATSKRPYTVQATSCRAPR